MATAIDTTGGASGGDLATVKKAQLEKEANASYGTLKTMQVEPFAFDADDLEWLTAGRAHVVNDQKSYLRGMEILSLWKNLKKRIDKHFEFYLEPLNRVRNWIFALRDDAYGTLEADIKVMEKNCAGWKRDQDRKDEEERLRKQREEDAKAEADRKKQIDTLKTVAKQTEDPLAKRELQEQAKILKQAPIVSRAVPKVSSVPKASGYVVPKYKGRVDDLMALVKAVAAGKAPIKYLQANESAINDDIKQYGHEWKIAGVTVIDDSTVVNR